MKTVQFGSRSSSARSSSQQFQISSRQEIATKEVRVGRRPQQRTVNCVSGRERERERGSAVLPVCKRS
jgi:hypothetical protein